MSGIAVFLLIVTRRGLSKQPSGGSCVHCLSGRGVSATPNCLGSICEKVQALRFPISFVRKIVFNTERKPTNKVFKVILEYVCRRHPALNKSRCPV